jgi:hypothetical protein
MRFVRQPATGGQEREIKNLRVYQFTLYNASGVNLRNSQIQFEFSSDDVQPWVDRPTRSRTALTPVEALSTPPWKTTFRWQIPNLPPRDSVEFSFDGFEPTSEDYEAALYSDLNVVLRKTKGEPERPVLSPAFVVRSLAVTAMVVAIVSFALLQYQKPIEDSHERLLRDAVAVLDEAEKSPTDHERVVKRGTRAPVADKGDARTPARWPTRWLAPGCGATLEARDGSPIRQKRTDASLATWYRLC